MTLGFLELKTSNLLCTTMQQDGLWPSPGQRGFVTIESLLLLTFSAWSLRIQVLVALPQGLSSNEARVHHNNLVVYPLESNGITLQIHPSPLPLVAEAFTLSLSLNLGILPFTPPPPLPIVNIADTRVVRSSSRYREF